jgi:hypothetical protein
VAASGLWTNIEELQSVNGSCSVQVSFVKHPADWDVKGYILQHPVMQQQDAAQPSASAAGSPSATQYTERYAATLTHTTHGGMMMKELPIYSILKALSDLQC